MARSRKLIKCRFLPYHQARTCSPPGGTMWLDVSRSADPPMHQLSPFYDHGGIPIPGRPGQTADSVEGIWQGLKVIRGRTAPRYFSGGGQKRGGKPAGHQLGNSSRLLGLIEARRRIYLPAYQWVLEHRVDQTMLDEIVDRAFRGIPQYFYDREDNGCLEKDQPLAHASILAEFINRRIDRQLEHGPVTS